MRHEPVQLFGMQQKLLVAPDYQDEEIVVANDHQSAVFWRLKIRIPFSSLHAFANIDQQLVKRLEAD